MQVDISLTTPPVLTARLVFNCLKAHIFQEIWFQISNLHPYTGAQAVPTPCERFLAAFARALHEHLSRTHAAAGFVRDTLLSGFPRLVTLLESLHEKLHRDADAKGVPPCVRRDGSDLAVVVRAADPLANAFLARSFQRLSVITGRRRCSRLTVVCCV